MTRRTAALVVGFLGAMACAVSPIMAADTLPAPSSNKTRLVVKLRSEERINVKSRFEANPPTIVIEFPAGRVAASLPERSTVQQGVVQEIRTSYGGPAGSSEGRWLKSVSIQLSDRYPFSVRPEAGQIVIEIEHPQGIAKGAFEVGLASGAVVSGETSLEMHRRFRAMQDALQDAVARPASATETTSTQTAIKAGATPTLPQPSGPVMSQPRTGARPTPTPKLLPARQAIPVSFWLSLAVGLLGTVASILWALKLRARAMRGRRGDRTLAIDVIDQLVWRAFEQQGSESVQTLQGAGSSGPLRVISRDGVRAALQCVSGGTFFEKATVEQFSEAMKAVSAEQGFLVAAGSFTVPAQRFAKDHGINLIGREQLTELLSAGAAQEHFGRHLQDIEGQLTKTRETLDEYAKQLDMIRRQRNEACWLLGEERARLAKVEAEHDDLQRQATQWRAEAEEWQATAKLNHKKWEESQWYLGESRAFAEHLESQLQPMKDSYAQTERRLRELNEQLQDAAKVREEAKWYQGESQQANAQLQEQLQAAERQLAELQERLQQLDRQFHDSQRSLASERMAREQLEERLAILQANGERRKTSRRFLPDATVEVETPDGTLIYQGTPRDVSGQGVGIGCEKEVPLPESANVRLSLQDGTHIIESTGRLVWNRESPDAGEQWSGYEFVDLPMEIRRAIEQLLTLPN